MTTDIVVRYAENISFNNEIADFRRYSINGESIAAVSWELPKVPRKKAGEYLLKKMVEKKLPDTASGKLHLMIEMSPEQPDNAIINHRKAWGLLKARGIRVDHIYDKVNFIKKSKNGLILSCAGIVDLQTEGVIDELFNCEEKVYFSLLNDGQECKGLLSLDTPSDWTRRVWSENGIVFMLMGHFDEVDGELVALGHIEQVKDCLLISTS